MVYLIAARQAGAQTETEATAQGRETKASKTPQLSSRAYLPPSKTAITEVVKPQERIVPPEEAKLTPPPPDAPDMATLIEMRRRARGVPRRNRNRSRIRPPWPRRAPWPISWAPRAAARMASGMTRGAYSRL